MLDAGRPPPQVGRVGQQLRAGGGDEQQRHVLDARGQELDQVHEALVGEVQVLERRAASGARGRPPPGTAARRRRGSRDRRPSPRPAAPTGSRGGRRPRRDPRRPRARRRGRGASRARRRARRCRSAGELRDVLGERAVRTGVAVPGRAAPEGEAAGGLDPVGELVREPRLPDPRGAEHRDERGAVLGGHQIPGVAERRELLAAPHDRDLGERHAPPRRRAVGSRPTPAPGRPCPSRPSTRAARRR